MQDTIYATVAVRTDRQETSAGGSTRLFGKVAAIKTWRRATGSSLKASKDFIEAIDGFAGAEVVLTPAQFGRLMAMILDDSGTYPEAKLQWTVKSAELVAWRSDRFDFTKCTEKTA